MLRELPCYELGWEETFQVSVGYILPRVRNMIMERRCDYLVSGLLWTDDPAVREPVDVLLSEIDHFVKHPPTGRVPGADCDTLEVGVGDTAEWVMLHES